MHISSTLFCSWDTSKLHPTRSIEDIVACAADLDHVVPDELHLFLRIMDILIENLISYAVELDIRATRKQTDLLQGATLKKVQASIQSCGVSYSKSGRKKRSQKSLTGHLLEVHKKERSYHYCQHNFLISFLLKPVNV